MFHVTDKDLAAWGGPALFKEAEQAVRRGDVLCAAFDAPWATGALKYAGRELQTRFRLVSPGMVESKCPCVANRRDGRICVHVVAVGVALRQRADNPAQRTRRAAELRHAQAVFAAEQSGAFVRRLPPDLGGVAAEIRLRLPADWMTQFWAGRVTAECGASIAGDLVPLDRLQRFPGLALQREDEALLFVLEDICEGSPRGTVDLTKSDLLNLLDVHRVQRRPVYQAGAAPLTIRSEAAEACVTLDLDRENGELLLFANAVPPGAAGPDPAAGIVAHGNAGWVGVRGQLWPLARTLPGPYQMVYHETVVVPRSDVVRFLRQEVEKLRASGLATEIDLDLFALEPAEPRFSVRVKGTPASVAVTLYALYEGDHELPACAAHALGDFAIPDPENPFQYRVRNLAAERAALARLNAMGFQGENGVALAPVVGERPVLAVLGTQVPAMRRLGWKVAVEGRVGEFHASLGVAVPVVRIVPGGSVHGPGGSWFDVGLDVQGPDGAAIAAADVQRALRMGESFLRQGDRTLLFDAGSVQSMQGVFRDCASRESGVAGMFRLSAVYAPYVQASLESLDGVDVEQPAEWRAQAAAHNRQARVTPVVLGAPLDDTLRPYQKEGVAWLRFLEAHGLGGILADEMGLGKTLQALAWLQLERIDATTRGLPALIVCPTSLVENWYHEARRFTPNLRLQTMTGARRHDRWNDLGACDVVVTSYALLRRDIERYREQAFACAILDEAQHIKNRSTQNAAAARQLRARHRLVLTGTPVENSVADLWSLTDFLMPGYLGDYETFRDTYELPIATLPGAPEAAEAQQRLRRKLHPFLLRRRKREVAADLPARLVKVSYCALTPDQRVAYDALLAASRQKVTEAVETQGFDRARIAILAILMRLRQVCCHLGLLKDAALLAKAGAPSGKMEQFLELLDEAIDGGHRMLVFSQFVSMLGLLRAELEQRGVPYCYLDGATKDRLATCQRFNRSPEIPVFLISLKAGGTGLNLTGANMVVHFDPWWNPAVEDQATDRAHRIGQTRTVYSVKLIAAGTVEEKVLDLQRRKRDVIGAIVEGDEQTMAKLSWDDVRALLDIGSV